MPHAPHPFVGRAAELTLLGAELSSVAAGQPRFVLVDGEGGSGKTSLLQAFRASVGDAPPVVVSGDEAESALPYAVADELTRQVGGGAGAPGPPDRDPFAGGASLLQALGEASRSGPLTVVLDDVHLADAPSVAALTFAVRRLQADPVLVVAASRDEQAAALPPGLLRLARDRGTRLHLEGLTVEEIRALAAALGFGNLSSRAATRLRDHTGGNALHLRAVLAELTPAQLEAVDEPLPVPRSLALLVRDAVRDLDDAARRLAASAAVLGSRSTLAEAAALAEVRDPRAAADALGAVQITELRQDRDGVVLGFRHPLIRAAVYDDIGLVERAARPQGAAARRSGAAALAHRVAAAVGPDAGLADALRAQADADAAAGRLRAAATGLLAASRLSEPGPRRDAALLDALELLLLEGDLAAVLAHLAAVDAM